jgi:hypothetical protein
VGHSAPLPLMPMSPVNDEVLRVLPFEEQRSSPAASMLLRPRSKIRFANKDEVQKQGSSCPANHLVLAPLTMNCNKQGFATANKKELYVPSTKKSTLPKKQFVGFGFDGLSNNTMYDGLSASVEDTAADDGSLVTLLNKHGDDLEEPSPKDKAKKKKRKKAATVAACWEHDCCSRH